MSVIQDYQNALNEAPPLKVDITPTGAPVQEAPTQPLSIPTAAPAPLPEPAPQQPILPVTSTGEGVPPIPDIDPLSFGETVSRMSAQSAAEIQKTIQSSGTPKPNEVQKQLLGSQTPVQIDSKLTSQNNPFAGNEPKNAQERLAFEPPVLANGLSNPFSDKQAIAALKAGVTKGEYLAYKKALEENPDKPLFDLGIESRLPKVTDFTENFEGKSAEDIRAIMSRKSRYNQARRAFNQAFLPLAGDANRSELETLFSALALPANIVKGVALDLTRAVTAAGLGGFNLEEISKQYNALRPTQGGTFTGAAVLGADFSFMSQKDEKGKPFNPLASVRDDTNIFQVGASFLGDILLDPLNVPAVETKLFGLLKPKAPPTPLSAPAIVPEVLAPVTPQLPPSDVAGTLPPARTIDVEARVLVTPPNPVQSDRVITLPTRQGTVLPFTPPRKLLQAGLDAPMQPLPELKIPEAPKPDGVALPPLEVVIERPRLPDLSALVNDAASVEILKRAEPVQIEFPTPRQPYTPLLDDVLKATEPDVAMYNNVTALFNDSPELPVVQRVMREVVQQKEVIDVPPSVMQNPVLREVVEYARTGDLTPNIAVLKGATADEIADIVADRLEVIRDSVMKVPPLKEQPLELPTFEFALPPKLKRTTFQGSVKPIDTLDDSFYRESNMYGNGFYTTDSKKLADEYSKRNGSEGVVYEVGSESRLYDLESSLDVAAKSRIVNLLGDNPFLLKTLDNSKTLASFLDEARQGLSSPFRKDKKGFTNLADSIAKQFESDGFDGYSVKARKKKGIESNNVSIFWRPSKTVSIKPLEEVIPTPTTLPTLQQVQASVIDDSVSSGYRVNSTQYSIEQLRIAMLREQGYSGRDAARSKVYPISDEIRLTGRVSDQSLLDLVNSRELTAETPTSQKWSSKLLQQVWEVSTPQQRAYLMNNLNSIEELGLERIARPNVIDDFLPPEEVFDFPC